MLDKEIQELMIGLLGFSLALVQLFSISLFLRWGMGMFTLCHFLLVLCNFLNFTRTQPRVTLNFRVDFGLGLLSNAALLTFWEGISVSFSVCGIVVLCSVES